MRRIPVYLLFGIKCRWRKCWCIQVHLCYVICTHLLILFLQKFYADKYHLTEHPSNLLAAGRNADAIIYSQNLLQNKSNQLRFQVLCFKNKLPILFRNGRKQHVCKRINPMIFYDLFLKIDIFWHFPVNITRKNSNIY